MSVFKYFAPPEWDNDVPRETRGENLTKKSKLKKMRKNENNIEKSHTELNIDIPQFQAPEVIKQSKKRKKESNEAKSKKKKHALNTESYVKFESPKLDTTFESISLNVTPSTPVSKNSMKKKQRREKNGPNLSKESSSNFDKSNSISHSPKLNKKLANGKVNGVSNPNNSLMDQSNTPNSGEKSWKTLKNRKRRAKKTKMDESVDSSNANESQISKVKKNKPVPISNGKLPKSKAIDKVDKSKSIVVEANDSIIEVKSKVDKSPSKKDKKNTSTNKSPMVAPKGIVKNSNLKRVAKIKKMLQNITVASTSENKPNEVGDSEILAEINGESEKKPLSRSKSLRERMMEKIKGARFRYLNEQMYLKQSNEAIQLFREDPGAFQAYHDGYKQQVNKWPLNPLDIIISDISKMPRNHVVADLGCGEARLAQSVQQKVHSFDLVALNSSVTACDMCHTPLLTGHVDIVVFCLSLMGTNLRDNVMEANRILKIGGLLKIAEVESRFENVDQFTSDVQKYGFSLIKKDLNNELFYFMDFKKETDVKKRNKVPPLNLNPCFYKKR